MTFRALQITETPEGVFERQIINRQISDLPSGDVLVRVHYSALNYKDGLSATGHKGISKNFPHTPGIEASGEVIESTTRQFKVGSKVFVTGYDLGMNTSGAFAEYIRVPAEWLLQKPDQLSCKEVMTIGTAGLTAAYALTKMEMMGQTPDMGPIVVTGSTGGVGSLAVAILAKAGYEVIAVTGKPQETEYLKFLGASRVEPRSFADDPSGRPLKSWRWAGAIDTVSGNTLTTLLKMCKRDGCVVATGLLAGNRFQTPIYPFILNGVNLLGIGAGHTPMSIRQMLWKKLTHEWNVSDKVNAIAHEVTLDELKDKYIDAILAGQTKGRVVVRLAENCVKEKKVAVSTKKKTRKLSVKPVVTDINETLLSA